MTTVEDEESASAPLAVKSPYPDHGSDSTQMREGPTPSPVDAATLQQRPTFTHKSLIERPVPTETTSFLSLRSPKAPDMPDSPPQQKSSVTASTEQPKRSKGSTGPGRGVIAGVKNIARDAGPYSRFL